MYTLVLFYLVGVAFTLLTFAGAVGGCLYLWSRAKGRLRERREGDPLSALHDEFDHLDVRVTRLAERVELLEMRLPAQASGEGEAGPRLPSPDTPDDDSDRDPS